MHMPLSLCLFLFFGRFSTEQKSPCVFKFLVFTLRQFPWEPKAKRSGPQPVDSGRRHAVYQRYRPGAGPTRRPFQKACMYSLSLWWFFSPVLLTLIILCRIFCLVVFCHFPKCPLLPSSGDRWQSPPVAAQWHDDEVHGLEARARPQTHLPHWQA